jgi:hypothetical protein
VDGWHWLSTSSVTFAAEWKHAGAVWSYGGYCVTPEQVPGWRYLCPIPCPTEITAQAQEVERLWAENAALAADQCHDGYSDEHGNHRCRLHDAGRKAVLAWSQERGQALEEINVLKADLAASDARKAALVKALDRYVDTYCEGSCLGNGGWFGDCGGCPARKTLDTHAPNWRTAQ